MPSDRCHCLPALLGSQVRHRIRLNGIQIAAQAVPGHLQFEAGLEAKPELGAAAEEPREPKRGSSQRVAQAGLPSRAIAVHKRAATAPAAK